MLSVIIPHHGSTTFLNTITFPFLQKETDGLFGEIIIISTNADAIVVPSDLHDRCRVLQSQRGRGRQLHQGAQAASGTWFLFLHADTELIGPWQSEIHKNTQSADQKPAVFRLTYDDDSLSARFVGTWGTMRSRLFGVPYGDQGLLMSAARYHDIGGFDPDLPLMEDVDLMERLGGKGSFTIMKASTRTSSEKYLAEGWFRRGTKHWWYYFQYRRGASPVALYERYYNAK